MGVKEVDLFPESAGKFLRRHHVMTLGTVADDVPYCANAFYAFESEDKCLIFTSDRSTHHAEQMMRNNRVSVSVVLETKIVGRVQGAQICGRVREAEAADRAVYVRRFPYAAVADLTLWRVEIDMLKYTDNTLGFGEKIVWNRVKK